eukprot:6199226-Pyramimonas_sp.AAC.1
MSTGSTMRRASTRRSAGGRSGLRKSTTRTRTVDIGGKVKETKRSGEANKEEEEGGGGSKEEG